MPGLLRTIVIVGGGFCGTIVAANLLRRPPPGPTRLVMIERAGAIGRGVAYADRGLRIMRDGSRSHGARAARSPSVRRLSIWS